MQKKAGGLFCTKMITKTFIHINVSSFGFDFVINSYQLKVL